MKHRLFSIFVSVAMCALVSLSSMGIRTAHAAPSSISSACITPGSTNKLTVTLGGANDTIEVPQNWNGTLLLFSHGYFPAVSWYTSPSSGPFAISVGDTSDAATRTQELADGYALAGSDYSQEGWAIQQAISDNLALVDYFNATCGTPARTILTGGSMGGLVTIALAELYPNRFSGAVIGCGVLSGAVDFWNQKLDAAFAFSRLFTVGSTQVQAANFNGSVTDASTAFAQIQTIAQLVQLTPQGRAQLALVAALDDMPGWTDSTQNPPASTDYVAQEQNQYAWIANVLPIYAGMQSYGRAELETRFGGEPSWNTGIDYRVQLQHSVDYAEVQALYQQAGINLDVDLQNLNNASRINADPQAVANATQYYTPTGNLQIPVITTHGIGDPFVTVQNEQVYANTVAQAGHSDMLRQTYVNSAGHCNFSIGEAEAALGALNYRLDTGSWGDTSAAAMNQAAIPTNGTTAPRFIDYTPASFLRP